MSDEKEIPSGFTRRDLVRGAVAGVVAAKVGGKAPAASNKTLGPQEVAVELIVNGKKQVVNVEPRVVLADALRDRLGLTGTKVVCGRGACGACTVLVDGETQCSCLLLAAEVRGKKITTIEGLASDNRLAPIQQAFVAADALQCGFCTSGMILSCKSLLDRHPRPTREQIRHAVSGNLCRCGTYPHVFEAVEKVAGIRTAEDPTEQEIRMASLFESRVPIPGSRLHEDERVDAGIAEILEIEET